MKTITKQEYEEELNEIGIPEEDKESNGGRIPDNCNYGTWLRSNDPIGFNLGYWEEKSHQEWKQYCEANKK